MRMSPILRAKHPKIILGVVGALIAIPVLGITISLVGANANAQQDVSVEESAQDEVSVQHETVPTVAAAPAAVESMPAQSPLPDPLAPEPTRAGTPSASVSVIETQEQEPTSEPKVTATPTAPKVEIATQPVVTEQVVNEPKTVKKNRSSWWVDSPDINSRNGHAARTPTQQ